MRLIKNISSLNSLSLWQGFRGPKTANKFSKCSDLFSGIRDLKHVFRISVPTTFSSRKSCRKTRCSSKHDPPRISGKTRVFFSRPCSSFDQIDTRCQNKNEQCQKKREWSKKINIKMQNGLANVWNYEKRKKKKSKKSIENDDLFGEFSVDPVFIIPRVKGCELIQDI